MKSRQVFALTILGGLLSALAVFLIITLILGDDSSHGGSGISQLSSVRTVR